MHDLMCISEAYNYNIENIIELRKINFKLSVEKMLQ